MRLRAQARWWWSALAVAGVPALASTAHAQGFGLNEIGSCAIGRGFAVTGAPCEDASVLYWNPAAGTILPQGMTAYVGATAVSVKGSFTADYTGRVDKGDVPVEVPPFAGVAVRDGRVMVGLAAYVPYGLTSQWKDDFPGRFSAQRASLQTIYVQPTASYDLVPGRLSIGVGGIVGYSKLELRQAADFSTVALPTDPTKTFAQVGIAPGTEFANVRVKGDATGAGYTVGVFAKPANWLSLGARYLSKVDFNYRGAEARFLTSPRADSLVFGAKNALGLPAGTTLQQVVAPQFLAGGNFEPGQTASTHITHPGQIQVGVGFTAIPNTTLSVDYARIQWDVFQELPVNFTRANGTANTALSRKLVEDYTNSDAVRVGLEHRFGARTLGVIPSGVAGRLGFAYAMTPAPDETVTPLLPDMDRYNFTVGAGIPLRGGKYTLDLAYLRVETEGRRGRVGERPENMTPAATVQTLNSGFYALNANVFSASVKARFF